MDTSAGAIVLTEGTKITLVDASEIADGEPTWVKFTRNDTGETLYLFVRDSEENGHQLQLADETWTYSGRAFENTLEYD